TRCGRGPPESRQDLEAAEPRHLEVEDDAAGPAVAHTCEGLEPVLRGDDLIAGGGQSIRDDLEQVGLIVDHQDEAGAFRDRASGPTEGGRIGRGTARRARGIHHAAARAAGSRTTNAAPPPAASSTQIRPPWSSTRWRAIVRPSPVPGSRSPSTRPTW